MRVIILGISLVAVAIGSFVFFTSFRSAFEADQACHFEKLTIYEDNEEFGCDHDLETNQWILFQKFDTTEKAKVIKRFRY